MPASDAYLSLVPIPAEDWQQRAACRGMNPELFYIERGQPGGSRAAKALCGVCLVKRDCLAHAIRNGEMFGIWGGLTYGARRKIVNRLKSRAA